MKPQEYGEIYIFAERLVMLTNKQSEKAQIKQTMLITNKQPQSHKVSTQKITSSAITTFTLSTK